MKSITRAWLFLPLTAAACLTIPSLHSAADSTASVKKAIKAQYDRVNAAIAKKDVTGVLAAYTKDRISIDDKGKTYTIDEEKQQLAQLFAAAQSLSGMSTIIAITVTGAKATVNVKEHGNVIILNPQTKTPSTLSINSGSIDTWVKIGGGWLQKKSVVKSQKTTLDGKVIKTP